MDENIVPPSRKKKHWLYVLLAVVLVFGAFQFGYREGRAGFIFEPKEFKVVNQKDQPQTVDYSLLWDAIEKLKQNHIDKPGDEQKILYGAVKGAVGSVGDPYTEFFTPDELKEFQTDLSGKFSGIGAEVGKRGGAIIIIAPLEGTPAEKAGLRPKDVVVKVNNELATDWSVEEAVSKIRGQKGTEVTLNIYREGESEPFDVVIVRDDIIVRSVKWEVKQVKDSGGQERPIGVITLNRFGDDTASEFNRGVQELLKEGIRGLILDVRSNPGGYLETSVEIASHWLKKDQLVVTEAHGSGANMEYKSKGYAKLAGVKTITLINGGSASASEILAGALHDHKVSSLLGEKSFGKGSVQEVLSLPGESAMKVTVAKWITPGGKNLNKDGLAPDIEVKMTDDDYKNQKDPQLERALEEIVK